MNKNGNKKHVIELFNEFYVRNRYNNEDKIIELINDKNFDINKSDILSDNLLTILTKKHDIKLLKILLERDDVDINYSGVYRLPILSLLSCHDIIDVKLEVDKEIIDLFIKNGANINTFINRDYYTNPLLCVILTGNMNHFNIYMNKNIDILYINNKIKAFDNYNNILTLIIKNMCNCNNAIKKNKEYYVEMLKIMINKMNKLGLFDIINDTIDIIKENNNKKMCKLLCKKHIDIALEILLSIESVSKSAAKR